MEDKRVSFNKEAERCCGFLYDRQEWILLSRLSSALLLKLPSYVSRKTHQSMLNLTTICEVGVRF